MHLLATIITFKSIALLVIAECLIIFLSPTVAKTKNIFVESIDFFFHFFTQGYIQIIIVRFPDITSTLLRRDGKGTGS